MKILTRYVFFEFLIPLGYCLSGFISIYVLFEQFGSFSRLMGSDIPFKDVVLYFCGYLSPYFHYLAPAALMLATMYTMWSFCRHSEIVAMRASGVSFLTIVKPLLCVAFALSMAVVYINECFVPKYAEWAAQMKNEKFDSKKLSRADNIVFRNAKDDRTWNIDELLNPQGTVLKNVKVSIDRPGGARLMTVLAEKAEYLDGEWWFSGTIVQHHDAMGQEIPTPTPDLDRLKFRCFPQFGEKPGDFITQNRPWKFNSVLDRFRYIGTHPEMDEKRRNEYIYDTWAQMMSPWACIVITLFAIPAGIASGRQSVFKGILGALAMYFSFYGVTIGFMIVAKNGWCPPIPAAILPLVIISVFGVRSFIRQR